MHQFSDSDTPDSDEGIRFKTDSTRNKESNRKSLDSSRKRRSSRSRSRSPEKRSNRGRSPDRSRDRYRERRSYSREWRRRHKSRDRSKERPAKYDRRDKRKRSASAELKRKRDDKQQSKSKERDTKKTPSTDKDVESTKQKNLKTTKDGEIHVEDSSQAFGPALPPKLLLLNDDEAKDSSSSVSPKRQCKHKKKHAIKSKEDDKTAALEKKTTLMSTSPISSDNDESVPDDDLAANKETLESLVPDVEENEHKDVIEIEDSDIEHENQTRRNKKDDNSSTNHCYGPDIPPKHTEDVELPSQPVGPFLPEHLRKKLLENADENGTADISLSDEDDEIEEGEIVGPILPGTKEAFSATQIALEERALQYKLDRLSTGNSSSDLNAREDWMLTLPEAGTAAKMGLGPRQFRAKAGHDMGDRSGWTDTPTDREAKQRSSKTAPPREDNGAVYKAEADKLEIEERDKEQERMARRHHKKHRKKDKHEKSLLEIHQDKLKSNKKDDDSQNIRRPFNRDTDLKVNQFDDAQKKAIYKKAQLLDDRFSKGESKYL